MSEARARPATPGPRWGQVLLEVTVSPIGDAVEEFYGEPPDYAHRADVDVDSTARALVGTYPEAPFRPAMESGI